MTKLFGRRASLQVLKQGGLPKLLGALDPVTPDDGSIDLSAMHFTFEAENGDTETPDSCAIRVFNLGDSEVQRIIGLQYGRVVLQAGYDGQFGTVFKGDIRQYRAGRLSGTDTYLDLLAADGWLAYNFATVNATVEPGDGAAATVRKKLADAFQSYGVEQGVDLLERTGGVVPPRGKVLQGMARAQQRLLAESAESTWSISDGKLNVVPLDAYLPGEIVTLTSATGLVGIPEQTETGIKARCLLNPRIVAGGLVRIDNRSINRTYQGPGNILNTPFNQAPKNGNAQFFASVTADGLYRVYVAEHNGDTRGDDWYTDLVCLSVDPATKKVLT